MTRDIPQDEFDQVAAEVRAIFDASPSTSTRSAHLAAMAASYAPAPAELSTPRRGRRGFGLRTGIAAAGLVLVAGSALAAAGSLPDAAQDVVADAVSVVGVDLPGGRDDHSTPPQAEEGKAGAEANRAEADAFTTAKKEWTACVSEKAPEHEGPGPFDPEEACGEKPQRSAVPTDAGRPEDPGANRHEPEAPPAQRPADPPQNPRPEQRPDDPGRPDEPGRSAEHRPAKP